MKLDHVGISVADLDASLNFYAQVLGFVREESRFELPEVEICGVVLTNADGARVELFERRDSRPDSPGHPTDSARRQGLFQFALRCADLSTTYRQVTRAGARAIMAPKVAPDGHTLIAFIGDIDGNLIELVQRTQE